MRKLSLSHIIIFFGFVLLGFIFMATIPESSYGQDNPSARLVGILISAILLLCGLVMWITRKDLALRRLKTAKLENFSFGHILVLFGALLAIFALGADLLKIGNDLKIGETQIMGVITGIAMVITGLALWGSFRDRTIKSILIQVILFLRNLINEAWSTIVHLPSEGRIRLALLILGTGLAGIFFLNNIFPRIDVDSGKLLKLDYFHESTYGLGADCRVGLYRQSYMALHHADLYVEHTKMSDFSNYPPFTHVFFMPLQLLSENQAYKLIVVLLFITNIIVLGMMTVIIRDTFFAKLGWEKSLTQTIPLFLFVSALFYNLTGYPFLFSIERGNYDIIASFFAILSVYILIKKPEALWWQVITLSIAANLKVYPAALFIALLIKHGKKVLLPALIVNLGLLLSLGYSNELKFFEVLFTYSLAPDSWAGNHSGFSFADLLVTTFPVLESMQTSLKWLFTLLPLVIWLIAITFIIRNFHGGRQAVLLFMVSIPLMLLFPSTSHDYALVILGTAIMVLIAILIIQIHEKKGGWTFAQLFFLLVLLGLIDRSTYLFPPSLQIISNKYPWLLLLLILMLVAIAELIKIWRHHEIKLDQPALADSKQSVLDSE